MTRYPLFREKGRAMLFRYKGSYLSYIVFYTGYYAVFALFGSVLSVYLNGLGLSDQEMSLILSAAGIFSFFVTPFSGYLHDRARNQKAVLAVTLALIAGLAMVFSACRGVGALFLLNGLVMSLINSVSPVCERIAGSSKYRYGVLRVWGTIGYAAGAQSAGLAVQHLPGWALFGLTAGACGLCLIGLLGAQVAPAAQPHDKAPTGAGREKPPLSALLNSPPFFLFLAVGFLFAGCSSVNNNYAPILLGRLGVEAGGVGTVLFFSTLTEIPLILFSHRFMDRLSGKVLTEACLAMAIGQYLAYSLCRTAWAAVAVMVLVKAVCSTLYMMLSLKMVRCIVPAGLTTTGLAVVATVNNLAGVALQNLGGYAAGRWGMGALYGGMAVLCAGGMLLAAFLKVKNDEPVFSAPQF